ncbi:mechanosensitive ion channel domain-containing protein [uncultured Brevundimonas sp.]|uniref:mechanosensitive ion channel family protein n=1 Tax=uncultured Brevundimonas sp. TaxID=213418 RepID=UPI0030EF524E|tara:strand:+ start:4846 stop:5868 length:1023 start_codon:yes stop_codon:yes gene_type:complete
MLPDLTALESTRLIKLGHISLTLGGVLSALVVIVVAVALAWLVTRGIRKLRVRARRATGALYLLEKLVGYAIIVTGVMMALSTAGLNLSSLAVFAGAIGIGVGLGLQGVVKEFVSGLFVIFDGMVSVGDYVELEGARGVIAEIGPRATRIRNNDNIDVVVPNSKLIEGTVTNWTLKGDTRRIHIPFGVAYESNRAAVREAVLAAARASPFTLPETETRKSQVWLTGFGDSSLNFELLVWPTLDAVKRPAAMHAAYTWAIADALDAAGIEIPFPQTDLRVRSLFGHAGDDGLDVMGLKRPRPAPRPAAAAAPTANDAAEELSHPAEPPTPETGNGDADESA